MRHFSLQERREIKDPYNATNFMNSSSRFKPLLVCLYRTNLFYV